MPCRTPRIAASSVPSLWITDDILAEAFNRFLVVSHTHRRFGSNIPGPLEARRRLAKRRLGLSAVPTAGSVPPPHDFGGLFGLGAARPPEFEKGWRWQAPVPAKKREDIGFSVFSKEVEIEWGMPTFDGSVEQDVESEETSARIDRFWEVPEDSVQTSTNAFTKLLETAQHKDEINAEDLRPFIDFMESSANEPDAHLTHRLTQWLTDRTTTEEAMDSLLLLIRQKMSLSTISLEEQSAILTTLTASNKHLVAAYRLFSYSQNLSLINHTDLPIKLIENGQVNNNKIWHLFDHRAREACGVPDMRNIYSKPLPQDLIKLVQEAAYAWSRSPHLRARVAYRRVWECWRFLTENRTRLTPLMSRALVRAGIANFVRARMPVPKNRVQHLLKLVGQIEGHEVKKEVDRLVFGYWMGTRNLTRYKPWGQARREKFEGEQRMEDGSIRKVGWKGRVLREAVEMKMRRKEEMVGDVEEGIDEGSGAAEMRIGGSLELHAPPAAESEDFLYPVFGVQGHDEVVPTDIEHSRSTEMSTPPLEPPKSPDSASEVEELTALALEHRGVLPEEAEIEEWPFVTKSSNNSVDHEPSMSFQPFEAAEANFSLDSSPSDESASIYKPSDHSLETESVVQSSLEEKDWVPNLTESAPDAARTTRRIAAERTTSNTQPTSLAATLLEADHGAASPGSLSFQSAVSSFRRLNGWRWRVDGPAMDMDTGASIISPQHNDMPITDAKDETITAPALLENEQCSEPISSQPALTSFHSPSFRWLAGWFKDHDDDHLDAVCDDPGPSNSPKDAKVEFVSEMEGYTWKWKWQSSAPDEINAGSTTVKLEKPTIQTETMVAANSMVDATVYAPDTAMYPMDGVSALMRRDGYADVMPAREPEAQRLRGHDKVQAKANRMSRRGARKDTVQRAMPTIDDTHASQQRADSLHLASTTISSIDCHEGSASTATSGEEATGAVNELHSALPRLKYHAVYPDSSDGSAKSIDRVGIGILQRHKWKSPREDEVYTKRVDLRVTKSKIVRLDSQLKSDA